MYRRKETARAGAGQDSAPMRACALGLVLCLACCLACLCLPTVILTRDAAAQGGIVAGEAEGRDTSAPGDSLHPAAVMGGPDSHAPRTRLTSGGAGQAGARGPDGRPVRCQGEGSGWKTPQEILLSPSPTSLNTFEYLSERFASERVLGAAERKAAQWLMMDEVSLEGSQVRMRKEYGERFEVVTFTGLGPWAEIGVQADYRLRWGWHLRSETRERGESFLEVRREFDLP